MIELKNISKSYSEIDVLDQLNLKIMDHKLTVIIGPSGCGKSTTLRLINGMIKPNQGEVLINQKNIKEIKPEILRRNIGYVIQNVGLFPHLTIKQNIAVVPHLLKWKKDKIEKRIQVMLKLIGLPYSEYADKYPHELSGGEAQRVGVARALASDPPILLMDEPFAAVDPITRKKLQNEFLRIQKELKKTIVFVTHDIDEAIKLADHVVLLKKGELIQSDTPEEILKKPANKFVHDFIGTDRALKRLSRLYVEHYMKKTRGYLLDKIKNLDHNQLNQKFYWLINQEQKLCGWLQKEDLDPSAPVENAATLCPADVISVKLSYTLRESFSMMLEEGMETIAVTDYEDRLIGEISIDNIINVIRRSQAKNK